eukprot:TRINITY_DN5288_c1_g1_i2.p1 TRINITY_DN5288_c1_g1~~TRINITY_DN5288_c1_g1_i2.p1  ORF type:complete len:279 (+),score=87.07 TRINITY_DN5288_c1_g1_i2:330-1166(+)
MAENPTPASERNRRLSYVLRLRGWAPNTTPAQAIEFLSDVPCFKQTKIGERDVVFTSGREPDLKRPRPDPAAAAAEDRVVVCEVRVASEEYATEVLDAKHAKQHNGRVIQVELLPDVHNLLIDPELHEGSTLVLPLDSASTVRKLVFLLQRPLYERFQVSVTAYCNVIPLPDPASSVVVSMDVDPQQQSDAQEHQHQQQQQEDTHSAIVIAALTSPSSTDAICPPQEEQEQHQQQEEEGQQKPESELEAVEAQVQGQAEEEQQQQQQQQVPPPAEEQQ